MCIPLGSIINELKSFILNTEDKNKKPEYQHIVKITESASIILESANELYEASIEYEQLSTLTPEHFDETMQKINEITEKYKKGSEDASKSEKLTIKMVKELEFFKKESIEKARILREAIQPEIEKSKKLIEAIEKAKNAVVDDLVGKKPTEQETFETIIENDIQELKEDLNSFYEGAMKATRESRERLADRMNELTGNDFKGRSVAKITEALYDVSESLSSSSEEEKEEVKAVFELNRIKNEFMTTVTDFIKEPKKTTIEGIEQLKKGTDKESNR